MRNGGVDALLSSSLRRSTPYAHNTFNVTLAEEHLHQYHPSQSLAQRLAATAVLAITLRALSIRAEGQVQAQVRHGLPGRPSRHRCALRKPPRRSARTRAARVDLQVYPTSQLGSEPDMISQTRSGARRLHVHRRHQPADAGAVGRHQRRRLRFQGLRQGVGGDGWRLGNHVRRAIEKVNLHALDKCSTTAIATSRHRRSRSTARRPEGIQDPRAGHPALDLDVQGARRLADRDPIRRTLFGACRPRSSMVRRTRWP